MTHQLVNYIIQKLKEHNITIQKYKSITTNSVYLKLDYGVLKSIRISDHKSKKHLHYRYNLQSNIRQSFYDRTNKRFFYTNKDVDVMLKQILSDRHDKMTRYKHKYMEYMNQNLKSNRHRNGFWKESTII